ncbi:MAG: hypothetical protein ACT4OS_10845 [Acidimicrobiales bacterium]
MEPDTESMVTRAEKSLVEQAENLASRARERSVQIARDAGGDAARSLALTVAKHAVGGPNHNDGNASDNGQGSASGLVGRAGSMATSVMEEATGQVRRAATTATDTITESAEMALDRVSARLHGLAEEILALSDGRPDDASTLKGVLMDIADRLAAAAERVDATCVEIGDRGLPAALEDLTKAARRRPAAFAAAAAGAGLVAGRLARQARANRASTTDAQVGYSEPGPDLAVKHDGATSGHDEEMGGEDSEGFDGSGEVSSGDGRSRGNRSGGTRPAGLASATSGRSGTTTGRARTTSSTGTASSRSGATSGRTASATGRTRSVPSPAAPPARRTATASGGTATPTRRTAKATGRAATDATHE